MSVIGPRPQLVRDMTFMTKEQRMRHTAKPGLSGLAQVNGRNAITWEDKLEWDQKYIKKVGFKEDVRIILVFLDSDDIITPNLVEMLINEGENADFVMCGYVVNDMNKNIRLEYVVLPA